MTTNQMDVIAGIILQSWYKMEDMSYKEAFICYESIRKELSQMNEGFENDEGTVEDERDK